MPGGKGKGNSGRKGKKSDQTDSPVVAKRKRNGGRKDSVSPRKLGRKSPKTRSPRNATVSFEEGNNVVEVQVAEMETKFLEEDEDVASLNNNATMAVP